MKKIQINKIFEDFKRYCKGFIKYYGLTQYEIFYQLINLDDCRSSIIVNNVAGVCTIAFDKGHLEQWYIKDIKDKEINDEVKKVAFHEITELLLYEQWDLLEKFYSIEVIQKSSHSIVRVLENTLFEEIKDKIK